MGSVEATVLKLELGTKSLNVLAFSASILTIHFFVLSLACPSALWKYNAKSFV